MSKSNQSIAQKIFLKKKQESQKKLKDLMQSSQQGSYKSMSHKLGQTKGHNPKQVQFKPDKFEEEDDLVFKSDFYRKLEKMIDTVQQYRDEFGTNRRPYYEYRARQT